MGSARGQREEPGPTRHVNLPRGAWALGGALCCGLCALLLCVGRGGGTPLLAASVHDAEHSAAEFLAAAETSGTAVVDNRGSANVTQVPPFGQKDDIVTYLWWPLIFYMFYVMSVVCDDYLVPTVDAMCEHFEIPDDVAGATLVAFACNGPELLTNVCGIFVTKTSVGMGTIVGSAIFNVLVITGACPMVAPRGELYVNRKYFLRDAFFSALSIVLLWWALPVVDLLRASVLLGMTVVYAVVVAKSEAFFGSDTEDQASSMLEKPMILGVDPEEEVCPKYELPPSPSLWSVDIANGVPMRLALALVDGVVKPTSFALALTVPDLRPASSSAQAPLGPPSVTRMLVAFFASMAWLSGTAYVVCLGSDEINKRWGVPQAFLGLTLVAVGTSWPNLMASVITAREGRGAIAVSNALGSNVQNVFFVLAGPLWVSVLLNGDYVADGSDILTSVLWMGITLAFTVAAVAYEGFRLKSWAGWSFMAVYAAYLVQATVLA